MTLFCIKSSNMSIRLTVFICQVLAKYCSLIFRYNGI